MFRMWVILAFVLTVCCTILPALSSEPYAIPADSPLMRNEHPRILFTRADLPRLRERIQTVAKDDYQRLSDLFAGNKGPGAGICAAHARSLGVLYQLSEDRAFAGAAKAILAGGEVGYRQIDYTQTYDLIYETLTPEERIALAKPLVELVRRTAKPNTNIDMQRSLLAALAIYGAGAMDDAEILTNLRHAETFLKDAIHLRNLQHKGRGSSGGSMQYFLYPMHIIDVHAWVNCTGEDLWPEMNWIKQTAGFRIYHRSPFERRSVHIGLADKGWHTTFPSLGEGDRTALEYMHLVADRYNDGLCQWWTDEAYGLWQPSLSKGNAQHIGVHQFFGRVLYRNPEVTPVPPEKLPPARFFEGPGYAVMRSDWSQNAVYAHFQCGYLEDYGARHNSDNASFLIERSGHLANDTGTTWGWEHSLDYGEMQKRGGMNQVYYKSGPMEGNHHITYSNRTIAHNSILVYDKEEMQGAWGGINDGGQLRSILSPSWREKYGEAHPLFPASKITRGGPALYDYGDMLAYETSLVFDYACGDATRSYSPHKLDQFTRQFVYLRPEVFVVFDRVVSTKAEFPKRWLLHTNDMPAPLDGEDTRDPAECQAGEYLAEEAREARAGHYLSTARTHTAADMEGRLFVTTLLPKKAIVRKIGGRGHEFCVNDQNLGVPSAHTYQIVFQPKSFMDNFLSKEAIGNTFGLAGWRIEVEPTVKQRSDVFLHVLQATEKSREQMAEASLIERDGAAGAKVTVDSKVYEVTFNQSGEVGGHIKVTDGGKMILDRDLVDHIEDNYKGWEDDPRYREWMTNPHMRTVIGEKEQDEFRGE